MSYPYVFIATITKPNAFEHYITTNISWVADYLGNSISPTDVTLYSQRELTPTEVQETTDLMDLYEDPEFFLVFEKAINTPMSTNFTSDETLMVSNKCVLQTFIFTTPENDNDLILDSFKMIVEYNCPNTLLFLLVSNPHIDIEIYDITRDIQIYSNSVPLNEIETKWKALNILATNDTVFRSLFIGGLQYQTPTYDCVWQIRVSASDPTFRVRLNSLQQLFYSVE